MHKRLIAANVFNILDIVLTFIAVHYDIGTELNPIMQFLIQSPVVCILVKTLSIFLLTVWISRRSKHGDKIGNIAIWIVFIATLLIVAWNCSVIAITMLLLRGA